MANGNSEGPQGKRCSRVYECIYMCLCIHARVGQRVIKSKRHLCRLHLPSRKKHLTVPPRQGGFLTVENVYRRIVIPKGRHRVVEVTIDR